MTTTRVPGSAPQPARARSLGYLPALDGLRGVALVGVLLFHAGHLDGGFLGVDLFFVLSGFLITSLLLAEWQSDGSIDLRHFWSRRLRRLLPASLVALLAITTFAAVHLGDGALARYRGDALAALGNVANWRAIAVESDYWAALDEPSPLRHMWSLAIEEQLYLLWPVVLLGAMRLGRARRRTYDTALLLTIALYAASIIAMAVLSSGPSTGRAYYGTDTRASAVLIGAVTAMILWRRRNRHPDGGPPEVVRSAAPIAAAILGLAWVLADGEARWLYLWGFPLFAAAGAVLVAWVATAQGGPAVRLLEAWPLRTLGLMSYGIYLIHWPVYVALDADLGWSPWVLTTVRVAVSIALAALSLRFVEQPIRSGRVGTRQWRGLALVGVMVVVGSVALVTRGAGADRGAVGDVIEQAPQGEAGAPLVLLLGDSQATALSIGAAEAFTTGARQASATAVGCGIGPGVPVADGVPSDRDLDGASCLTAVDRFIAAVEREDPAVVLVHIGAWEVLDRLVEGRVVAFGTRAWDDVTRSNLDAVLRRMLAGGRRVVVLAAPCFPEAGEAGAEMFGDLARATGAIRVDEERVARWNVLLREVAGPLGVEVLPYDELFCGDPDGEFPRRDGVHLTEEGAEAAWAWILARLRL